MQEEFFPLLWWLNMSGHLKFSQEVLNQTTDHSNPAHAEPNQGLHRQIIM